MIKNFIKSLIPYVIIIAVVILIRTFLITPIRVNGDSMVPTLKNKDIMILNKVGTISRFDIVVINSSKSSSILIKRVIGLPGDVVRVSDGEIYINDKKIKDKYGKGKTSDVGAIKLKDDEYFVLGDNREVSADSRIFGPFNNNEIKGTTKLTIFPFNRLGIKK